MSSGTANSRSVMEYFVPLEGNVSSLLEYYDCPLTLTSTVWVEIFEGVLISQFSWSTTVHENNQQSLLEPSKIKIKKPVTSCPRKFQSSNITNRRIYTLIQT